MSHEGIKSILEPFGTQQATAVIQYTYFKQQNL
jgi:hypothetical protein